MVTTEETMAKLKASTLGQTLIEHIGEERALQLLTSMDEAATSWDEAVDLGLVGVERNFVVEYLIHQLDQATTACILAGILGGQTRVQVVKAVREQTRTLLNMTLFIGAHVTKGGFEFSNVPLSELRNRSAQGE